MLLKEAVRIIKGRLLYDEGDILNREYYCAIASDLMSNVMVNGEEDSILITSLVNPQVIRASEMMNITCIIITCGKSVTDTMIELAKNRNIALVETEDTTFTVCGKLHSRGMREGSVLQENRRVMSIRTDSERCTGCVHCARVCPTEAIRIKGMKASVNADRCIECGMCVKVCPRHAVRPVVGGMDAMDRYDRRIAIPASSFLGQFRDVKSRNHLLTALKRVGFDDVYEEAIGAEMVSYATRMVLKEKKRPLPVISSACPAILKLIQIRFPNLIDNVLDYRPPVEITAGLARKEAEKKYGRDSKIGIFFIAPCTSKISLIKESEGLVESDIDETVGISDIYKSVLKNLRELRDDEVEDLERAGVMGLRWASTGGESIALETEKFIAVDGVDEAVEIFESIEDEKFRDVEYIEAGACTGGCFGGSLTVENSYSAKANIKVIVDEAKKRYGYDIINIPKDYRRLKRDIKLKYNPVLQLDQDLNVAIKKMEEMGRILRNLPGLDCGVCGAPTCRALAEDTVRGLTTEDACIIMEKAARR